MAWCGRTHIPAESVRYTLPGCPLSKRTHQTSSTFRMIQNISQRNFWHSSRVIAQSPASEMKRLGNWRESDRVPESLAHQLLTTQIPLKNLKDISSIGHELKCCQIFRPYWLWTSPYLDLSENIVLHVLYTLKQSFDCAFECENDGKLQYWILGNPCTCPMFRSSASVPASICCPAIATVQLSASHTTFARLVAAKRMADCPQYVPISSLEKQNQDAQTVTFSVHCKAHLVWMQKLATNQALDSTRQPQRKQQHKRPSLLHWSVLGPGSSHSAGLC